MQIQMTFVDIEVAGQRKRTRREEFLAQMDSLVPWGRWAVCSSSRAPAPRRGRRGRSRRSGSGQGGHRRRAPGKPRRQILDRARERLHGQRAGSQARKDERA